MNMLPKSKQPPTLEDLTIPCPHCGKMLQRLFALERLDDTPSHAALIAYADSLPMVCDCAGARAQKEREAEEARRRTAAERRRRQEAIFAHSGMPDAWRPRNLAAWVVQTAEQAVALAAAEGFLNATRQERRSLFIVGDIGCGKTFLASCLARDMHRRGQWVLWARVGDILAEIRRSYHSREYTDPLQLYQKTACLVLDDLGKERPTEWAVEQLFSLVDARYNAGLPLIVTSNYGGSDLVQRLTPATAWGEKGDPTTGRAIVDRLGEMCELVTLTGKSRRQ